jgi:hypothetical protein
MVVVAVATVGVVEGGRLDDAIDRRLIRERRRVTDEDAHHLVAGDLVPPNRKRSTRRNVIAVPRASRNRLDWTSLGQGPSIDSTRRSYRSTRHLSPPGTLGRETGDGKRMGSNFSTADSFSRSRHRGTIGREKGTVPVPRKEPRIVGGFHRPTDRAGPADLPGRGSLESSEETAT